jgi:hypothetical protein
MWQLGHHHARIAVSGGNRQLCVGAFYARLQTGVDRAAIALEHEYATLTQAGGIKLCQIEFV